MMGMTVRGAAFLKLQVFDARSYRVKEDMQTLPDEIRDAVHAALRLQSFYQRWSHEHFVVRGPWDILRQMQGDRVIVIELQAPASASNSTIIAASIVWEYDLPIVVGAEPQAIRFLEVGTQRCVLNGFNLQQVLNSVSLMSSLIHDPQGIYFGAVYATNDRTIDNVIRHMDYVPWDTPPAALTCMLNHRTGTERTVKRIRFFRANLGSVFSAARCIDDLFRNRVRTRKQKSSRQDQAGVGQAIDELDLSCDTTLFTPLVRYSQRILALQPKDRATLKIALENPSIGDDFLMWNDAGMIPEVASQTCSFSSWWKALTGR
jgi:hypothetical protein